MGKRNNYYENAEELYTRKLKSIPEIAALLGVSQTSLYKWKREGDWDVRRTEFLKTPKTALELSEELLVKLVNKLNNLPIEELSARHFDSLNKAVKSVRDLKKGYSKFEIAILFGGDFVSWCNDNIADEQLRNDIFDIYNKYIEAVKAY